MTEERVSRLEQNQNEILGRLRAVEHTQARQGEQLVGIYSKFDDLKESIEKRFDKWEGNFKWLFGILVTSVAIPVLLAVLGI